MKILIIGRTGQLGSQILKNNTTHEIFAPDRSVLDVSSRRDVDTVVEGFRPDIVINTAAFHNVELCDDDPDSAFRINCVAVRDLAAACQRVRALFVTFSSDYVFGGDKRTPYREDDRPQPLQIYGISRLAGECAAVATAPECSIIIRTCGLYGIAGAQSKGGNFVDQRIADSRTRETLEMSCEQIVSPTSAHDLSRAVLRLIEHPRCTPGIYHLVNEGECSWYEFTKTIYELSSLDVEVKPVDRHGLSGTMRRPLYSALANTKAASMGIVLPHWQDGLSRYLRRKYSGQIKAKKG